MTWFVKYLSLGKRIYIYKHKNVQIKSKPTKFKTNIKSTLTRENIKVFPESQMPRRRIP